MMREIMKSARMSRKIFVFTPLPEDLLKYFLHMPVMGTFPIDFRTFPAAQEVCMGMIDVVRNLFSDILRVSRCQLTVAQCTTAPQGSVAAAEHLPHFRKLIRDMIRCDEYAMTCCLPA
jgi:hypothetical protein